jgi:hypothetical protein
MTPVAAALVTLSPTGVSMTRQFKAADEVADEVVRNSIFVTGGSDLPLSDARDNGFSSDLRNLFNSKVDYSMERFEEGSITTKILVCKDGSAYRTVRLNIASVYEGIFEDE